MQTQLTRYLVRRNTSDVYIWSEIIARRKDLEEVWAMSAEEALKKEALPDPRNIGLDQIDGMKKADLLIFATVKLGLKLDVTKTKEQLADEVKEFIFTRAPLEPAAKLALSESRPFASAAEMRGKTGDDATVAGAANAGPVPHQPVRS